MLNWIASDIYTVDSFIVYAFVRFRYVRVWDVLSGSCVRTFSGHKGAVRGLKVRNALCRSFFCLVRVHSFSFFSPQFSLVFSSLLVVVIWCRWAARGLSACGIWRCRYSFQSVIIPMRYYVPGRSVSFDEQIACFQRLVGMETRTMPTVMPTIAFTREGENLHRVRPPLFL